MFFCTEFNSTSRLQGKMFQKEYRDRYPFLVSLEKFGLQYCSGFVIALFKVATAAYCIHEDVETQNFSEIRAIIAYDEYKIDYGETAGCYKNLDEYPQYDFGILTVSRLILKCHRKTANIIFSYRIIVSI